MHTDGKTRKTTKLNRLGKTTSSRVEQSQLGQDLASIRSSNKVIASEAVGYRRDGANGK